MQIPDRYEKYGLALDCAAHWLHCYSISRQLSEIGVTGSIMVIYETGLDGTIYLYGNHGNYWERIGKLAGWA